MTRPLGRIAAPGPEGGGLAGFGLAAIAGTLLALVFASADLPEPQPSEHARISGAAKNATIDYARPVPQRSPPTPSR